MFLVSFEIEQELYLNLGRRHIVNEFLEPAYNLFSSALRYV